MIINIFIGTKDTITVDWPQVPNEGERLVIDGIEYKVYSRKWYIYNPSLPSLMSSPEVQIRLEEI